MLISGLQSILFAINIDNSSLNVPTKVQQPISTTTAKTSASGHEISKSSFLSIDTGSAREPTTHEHQATPPAATFATFDRFKKSNSTNSMHSNVHSSAGNVRRVRKNNVVLENESEQTSSTKRVIAVGKESPPSQASPTLVSPSRSLGSGGGGSNFNAIIESSFEFNVDELNAESVKPLLSEGGGNSLKSVSADKLSSPKEFNILTNPINYNQNKKEETSIGEQAVAAGAANLREVKSEESSGNERSSSPEKIDDDIYSSSIRSGRFKSTVVNASSDNLIPLSPKIFKNPSVVQNSNSADAISSKCI
jgi:hypothetical protein